MADAVFSYVLYFSGAVGLAVVLISMAAGASLLQSYLKASVAFYVIVFLGWTASKIVGIGKASQPNGLSASRTQLSQKKDRTEEP